MRTILTALALLLTASAASADGGVAFLKRWYVTGQTKTCVYVYLGSEYAITIRAYQSCPYSIRV